MSRILRFLSLFILAVSCYAVDPLSPNTSACNGNNDPNAGCNAASPVLNTNPANTNAQTQVVNHGPGAVSTLDVHRWLYNGATTRAITHWMPWFYNQSPFNSHLNIGMNENNSAAVTAQLQAMKTRGFNVVAVDYYGDDVTKSFNLASTNALASAIAADATVPRLMLILDQGAWNISGRCPAGSGITTGQMTTCINNLMDYAATHYFYQSYYEKFNGHPIVGLFLNKGSWSSVNWSTVYSNVSAHMQSPTAGYSTSVYLLDRNQQFSEAGLAGSYAWTNPLVYVNGTPATQFCWNSPNCNSFDYYDDFYSHAQAAPSKVAIGLINGGFDDSNASFGTGKMLAQQCGQVLKFTADKIASNGYSSVNQLPYVQFETWNDYEEGTALETGIDNCYSVTASLVGTNLSWVITPSDATYASLNTIDHIEVLYGTGTGDTYTIGVDLIAPALTGTVSIASFPPNVTWTVYVRLVGKPLIRNQISNALTFESTSPDIPSVNPISVTGTLQSGSSSGVKGNAFVRFRLRNYSGFVPRVNNQAILVQTQFDVKPSDDLGNFSASVYSNDDIYPNTCGATHDLACTFWTVEYWQDGKVQSTGNYCIPNTSPSFNLNTATQCQTPGTPPAPGQGGAAYNRIQDEGTNLPQRSTVNFAGGPITCVDNAMSGRTDCTVADPPPASSGYQTIQDEGTPLTQRTTANFTGNGITCSDSGGVTTCNVPAASGSGDIASAPASNQTITQPQGTRLTVNSLDGAQYVVSSFNWSQSPAADLSSAGSKTVTLTPCPLGVAGANPDHYVYIATTGVAEAAKITGGTCTSGAASGTITFVTVNAHSAGYTVATATGGWKEASEYAKFQPSNPTGSLQGGKVIGVPGTEYSLFAPLYLESYNQTIDMTGTIVECYSTASCIHLGADASSLTYKNIRLINPRLRPMVAGAGGIIDNSHAGIIDGLRIRSGPGGSYFTFLIQNDDNESQDVVHFDPSDGTWGQCNSSGCSVAIRSLGGVGKSGILTLRESNLTLNCLGNGIDWNNANTLNIQNTQIQGYSQFGVKSGSTFTVNPALRATGVYEEVGSCTNPLGVGQAGVIVQQGRAEYYGGVGPAGALPSFTASSPGATQFNYYVIAKSSTLGNGNVLLAGKCLSSGTGTCSVKWYQIGSSGTITYDVLRKTGNLGNQDPAPYTALCTGGTTTACGSVALAVTTASCSSNICTLSDDVTVNTSSYTVTTQSYTPKVDYWPGAIILAAATDTNNANNGVTEFYTDYFNSSMAAVFPPYSAALFAKNCDTITAYNPAYVSCQASRATTGGPNVAILQIYGGGALGGGVPSGLKGKQIFSLGRAGSASGTDIVTYDDSNTAATQATPGNRPTADTNDSAIGYNESGFTAPSGRHMGMRAPVSWDICIASVFNGTCQLFRQTATATQLWKPLDWQSGIAYAFSAPETTSPSNPAAGTQKCFIKSGTGLVCRDSTGTEYGTTATSALNASPAWWGSGDGSPYSWTNSVNGTFGTGTSNQVKFWMIRLPAQLTVNKLTLRLNASSAGSVSGFAVYNATGTTKLLSWDNIDTSSSVFTPRTFTLGATVILNAGTYIVAVATDAASSSVPTSESGYATAGTSEPSRPWNLNGTVRSGVAANSMSGGVMPSSLGTLSTSTALGTAVPIITMEP